MSHDLWVPMVQANEICARAKAQYLAEHPDTLRGWVRHSIPFREFRREPDGWVHVSNLTDDLQRRYWYVMWYPERDEVRLDGPRQ
jgi:hypothetical protein